jgi:hypothetical protein
MQLRYLKRAGGRSCVWPPVGSRYGLRDTAKLRLGGVLTNVLRIGDRLSVTIRFEGHDHVALLDAWKPPPTLDEVEGALRRGLSQTVRAVGLVDTRPGLSVPTPLTPTRPTPVPPTPDDHGF